MSYSTYSSEGRLIKGVIYDDVDIDDITQDICDTLHHDGINSITNYFAKDMNKETNGNLSIEDAILYLNNMNAISALTGYNNDTDRTSNFIIPKEALSAELQEELEAVDFGKKLIHEYPDHFFVDYCGSTKIEQNNCCEPNLYECVRKSCRFCNDCESELHEEVVRHIEQTSKSNKKKEPKYFYDGEKVSQEEFLDRINQDPKAAEMLYNVLTTLATGKIVCF